MKGFNQTMFLTSCFIHFCLNMPNSLIGNIEKNPSYKILYLVTLWKIILSHSALCTQDPGKWL